MTTISRPMEDDIAHCDDYINDPNAPECLREFISWHRQPAIDKYRANSKPRPVLYATLTQDYPSANLKTGQRVRVVMASRFGDLGITADFTAESGYAMRCMVSELCEWGTKP